MGNLDTCVCGLDHGVRDPYKMFDVCAVSSVPNKLPDSRHEVSGNTQFVSLLCPV